MYFCLLIFSFLLNLSVAQTEIQIQNNLSVQSFGKAEQAENKRTGYLGRSFLPSISFEVGQERFQTGRYKSFSNPYGLLEARFNLFKGGRDQLESGVRDLQAKIGTFNLSLAVRDEINKVRKFQWQIIHNNELVRILEKEKKDNSKLKEQATRRASSGVSTKSDVLEFTIHESELEETIESLLHENKILKIGLLPLLGLDSDSSLEFSQTLIHEHDEALLIKKFDSKQNLQVKKLDADYESFNLQKKLINRWWTPSLDLYGGYYLYTLRDRDYLALRERDDRVIGLRLSFELFDGLKSYNQGTAAHYQAESKRLMVKHVERQNEAQTLMYQEDLKHTHEVMHYVQDRISKSKDYLKVTLQEYDRGFKNSLDALSAMQRYYRYEKQYLEKKKEYQLIKADLLALTGE